MFLRHGSAQAEYFNLPGRERISFYRLRMGLKKTCISGHFINTQL
jgi:hypothetical protein